MGKREKDDLPSYLKHQLSSAARGAKGKAALWAAMRKYPDPKSWIIESLATRDDKTELRELEKLFIILLNSRKVGYNIASGGVGGSGPHTVESKAKIAAAQIGRKRPDLAALNRQRAGRTATAKQLACLSLAWARPKTDEWKRVVSAFASQRPRTADGCFA